MSTTINAGTLTSLAAKLDSLELADDEQAVLQALFARAADAGGEVEGYGVVFEVETTLETDAAHVRGTTGETDAPRDISIHNLDVIARGLGLDLG